VELKMKDVMEILQAPEKDVLKMIKDSGLPAHSINHQYMFNKQEIKEWVIKNGIKIHKRFLDLKPGDMPVSVAGLVKKGGILYGVKGRNSSGVLSYCSAQMKFPPELTQEQVLSSLIQREEMMPTAVGHGIAIPHPRNPIVTDIQNESITVCLPAHPVPYSAMDGEPVHTMFIVLSANPGRHLEILAKLLYLCQQPDFTALLKNKSPEADIIAYIEKAEAQIGAKKK
jgi:nitrogen PTS system EIIA component